MSAKIGKASVAKVIGIITGQNGVNSVAGALLQQGGTALDTVSAVQVRAQNVAPELAERGNPVQFPTVNVYCEKVVNSLVEKFRSFSGTVQMAIEVRHSSDRLETLQDDLESYADAVMQVLGNSRGDWGDGMFYCGGYQAAFGSVKQGGKNFLQTVKITFEIGVSRI